MWQLALPIMAGLVGQTLIGIADTVMVGAVGVEVDARHPGGGRLFWYG